MVFACLNLSIKDVTRELFVLGVSDRGMLITGIIDQVATANDEYVICDTKTTGGRRAPRTRRSVSEIQVYLYPSDYIGRNIQTFV
jgi:hypothetical protein